MDIDLPPPLAAFFQAFNANDEDAFIALFTADALVTDDGREHRGTAAIKEWIQKENADYQEKADITHLTDAGDEIDVTAEVTGTFPGSPIQLRYRFSLKDGKIAVLTCGI